MRVRMIAGVLAAAAVTAGPALAAGTPKAGLYVDAPKQVYVQVGADGKTVTLLGASCLTRSGGKLTIQRNGQWPVRIKLKADQGFTFKGKTSLGQVDLKASFRNGRYVGSVAVAGCEKAPFNAAFHAGGG